jgi:signal transduction histidine kinase
MKTPRTLLLLHHLLLHPVANAAAHTLLLLLCVCVLVSSPGDWARARGHTICDRRSAADDAGQTPTLLLLLTPRTVAELVALGAHLGCLSTYAVSVSFNTLRARRDAAAVAGLIFLQSTLVYVLLLTGSAPTLCSPVGHLFPFPAPDPHGVPADPSRRVHEPLRYLYWFTSSPPMVVTLASLAGLPAWQVGAAGLAQAAVIAAGFAAVLHAPDGRKLWGYCALSSLLFCFVAHTLWLSLKPPPTTTTTTTWSPPGHRRRLSLDSGTVRVLRVMGPVALALFAAFPLVWVLAYAGLLSPSAEMTLWPVLDVLAKVVVSQLWVAGDWSRVDAELDAQLREVDLQRVAADASNLAKRKFMRYIFHELRVPLNCITLGLEDVVETAAEAEGLLEAAARATTATKSSSSSSSSSSSAAAAAAREEGAGQGGQDDARQRAQLRRHRHSRLRTSTTSTPPAADSRSRSRGRMEVGATGQLDAPPSTTTRRTTRRAEEGSGGGGGTGSPGRLVRRRSRAETDTTSTSSSASPSSSAADGARSASSPGQGALLSTASDRGEEEESSPSLGVVEGIRRRHRGRGTDDTPPGHWSRAPIPPSSAPSSPSPSLLAGSALRLESIRQTSQLLQNSAASMTKLLNDFLSLEKVEEGKFELEVVDFAPREMVRDAARMFANPLAARQLTLTTDISAAVPATMRGDVHKLRQVLCNFLSNAIKFSPAGGTIAVRVDREAPPLSATTASPALPSSSSSVRFQVADEGVGISAEDQRKLFTPFVQIQAGAQQKGNGTGLGLSISSKIVELSGGRVGVRSGEGGAAGTTFFMVVPEDGPPQPPPPPPPPPRAQQTSGGGGAPEGAAPLPSAGSGLLSAGEDGVGLAEAAVAGPGSSPSRIGGGSLGVGGGGGGGIRGGGGVSASPRAAVSAPPPPLQPLRPLRVAVVVDDVLSNRELFGRLLERHGVDTLHFAEDGRAALDLAGALAARAPVGARSPSPAQAPAPAPANALEEVQAWFLDQEMPRLDGHGAARALRARGVTAPIIGVTGNALLQDKRAFVTAGADAVLTKPVCSADVEAAIAPFGLRLRGKG